MEMVFWKLQLVSSWSGLLVCSGASC